MLLELFQYWIGVIHIGFKIYLTKEKKSPGIKNYIISFRFFKGKSNKKYYWNKDYLIFNWIYK